MCVGERLAAVRPGAASATFEDTLAGHLHVTRATGAVAGPRLRHASTNTGQKKKVYITWVITLLQNWGCRAHRGRAPDSSSSGRGSIHPFFFLN